MLLLVLLSLVNADEYHQQHIRQKRSTENKRPRSFVFDHMEKGAPREEMTDEEHHPKLCGEGTCAKKSTRVNSEEQNPQFWLDKAKAELELALKLQNRKKKVAKNVILFLGDGMATASITASRILKGEKENKLGAEAVLSMDLSDYMGFSKTYNVDSQVADSAGTATAYLTGVKTDLGVVGLTAAVTPGVCNTSVEVEVQSILMDSVEAGKSGGIVTTTRLNHATPSGAYAHSAYRYWYDDTDLPPEAVRDGCTDIAYQLYTHSDKIEVLLGGGRKYFRPKETDDEEYDTPNGRGDGQDLIGKWRENMKNLGRRAEYVWNKKAFNAVDPKAVDHLWGMFEPQDMQYEVDRETGDDGEPSLTEMTEKAIKVLQKNEKGFFLLVEGGRIDHAHHGANAYRALHETLEFDNAIQKARDITSSDDTLIVVTADHGHTFTFAGYPEREVPIFGLTGSVDKPELDLDLKPHSSLLYGNGQGYQSSDADSWEKPLDREKLTLEMTSDPEYHQQSAVPLSSETHGGDDIPILATGPMAHLFHSVHEQSYIAHVMRYASCVGGVNELCEEVSMAAAAAASGEISGPKSTEFLGYKLNRDQTETALNALFGLEITFFLLAIIALFKARRK